MKRPANKIEQDEILNLFNYDSQHGELIWKKKYGKSSKKRFAGSLNTKGYSHVGINCKSYPLHRLIFIYHHGYNPENDIDHIDRNTSNNRICNLREVSRQCNVINTGLRATNNTGIKGVLFDNINKKWRAQITVNYKTYQLGRFIDFTEAVAHRLAAEQSFNMAGCEDNSESFLHIRDYCYTWHPDWLEEVAE